MRRAATSRTAGACACPAGEGAGFGCIGLSGGHGDRDADRRRSPAAARPPRPRRADGARPRRSSSRCPRARRRPTIPQAQFVGVVLKDTENAWQQVFQRSGKPLPGADPRALRRARGLGLRHGLGRGGALLLPRRPQGVPRHGVLPRALAALRRARRLRPGLRGGARGGPPRPEPAGPLRPGDRPPAAGPLARSRRTTSRSASSCRRTASPGSTATSTSSTSTPATSRRGCAPRPRSATT